MLQSQKYYTTIDLTAFDAAGQQR